MIITEHLEINGRAFTKTTSDAGRYVVREGISYVEAYDPSEFNRQYTEGEIIDEYDPVSAEELLEILLGGAE